MDELKPIIFILMLGNIASLVFNIVMMSKGEDKTSVVILNCVAIGFCLATLTKDD